MSLRFHKDHTANHHGKLEHKILLNSVCYTFTLQSFHLVLYYIQNNQNIQQI